MPEYPPRRRSAAEQDAYARRPGNRPVDMSLLQFAARQPQRPDPYAPSPYQPLPGSHRQHQQHGPANAYGEPQFAPQNVSAHNPYGPQHADPRLQQPAAPARQPPGEQVTIEKMGDFLELDFRRLFAWLRAGLALACALALVGAALGGAYAMLAKRQYTVATDIVVNPANLQVVNDDLFTQSNQVDAQLLAARSKQRILTSRNVLARVVDSLKLTDDPEFYKPSAVSSLVGGETNPKLVALANLQEKVNAEADDTSFVTTLSVSAETPDKAIQIADSIVDSFKAELATVEAAGASRAASALDGRLDKLKSDVQAAEEKVVAYRRAHNLSASNGQLVSSQTMTELNLQIVNAQARAASAQAAYDTLVAGGADGTNANPNVSQTLAQLRSRANSLRQEVASQSIVLGPRHPTIQKLQVEQRTVSAQVKAEFANNVQVAKGGRDAANAALASLNKQLGELQGNVFSDTESEVALRELERDATAKTAIYESFLSRARQITERERIDSTNVQVISTAVPPKGRSWPPRTVLLGLLGAVGGFAFGMMLATALGIWRDIRRPPARQVYATA